MALFLLRIVLALLTTASFELIEGDLYTARRFAAQPRTLLFPITSPTRVQFIGGIGIPVEDLSFESITSGYVLKAEYFLPTRADEFHINYLRPQTIHRRSLNGTQDTLESPRRHRTTRQRRRHSRFGDNFPSQQNSAAIYRWIVYRGLETLLNSVDLPGRTCLLRSICEHAAVPLYYDSGILSEVLHIILTPSTSQDRVVTSSDKEYFHAELFGRAGGKCELEFSECTKSPIDLITTVVDFNE